MKAFRFPLDKALEIRANQLGIAEARFREAAAGVADAERQRDIVTRGLSAVEAQVHDAAVIAGEDLAALEWFRKHSAAEVRRLEHLRAQCVQTLDERRAAMLEARRRVRLLERLKERRYEEWSAQAAKELEDLASESFLAQWRRNTGT